MSGTNTGKKYLALITSLLWFGLLTVAAFNRQNLEDWWQLRNYTPPAAVASIATQDTMTPYARKVLYVNHPALEDKTAFSQCSQKSEQTIVLGCYHGGQHGIFVLSVTDSRLDGVEQVTTAHELLHAAYDRLSSADKQHVNSMLQNYYQNDLHDQRILDTIAAYKKSEPDAVVDEMHSVFGTEIASLPADLETYYQKYFTNRAAVAGFAAKYEAEFTSRHAALIADDAQLDRLRSQINDLKARLQTQSNDLSAQQSQLTSYKASGNPNAYNAGVSPYNAAVSAYNSDVSRLRSVIAQYNQLVDARNAIALETQNLQAAISGQPESISH